MEIFKENVISGPSFHGLWLIGYLNPLTIDKLFDDSKTLKQIYFFRFIFRSADPPATLLGTRGYWKVEFTILN